MRIVGLIGFPLSHSFSPGYFRNRFLKQGTADCFYELFPLPDLSNLRNWVTSIAALEGFNVTIPHKSAIIPYLDKLSPEAQRIGAVNCVQVERKNGNLHLTGYNTDAAAFRETLLQFLNGQPVTRAAIIGNGGSAKAVRYVLNQLHIPHITLSRTSGDYRYNNLPHGLLADTPLWIQCTPAGMYPHTTEKPLLPYSEISAEHYLYDLIYNPEKTSFLEEGEKRGAHMQNGLDMLHRQAEKSAEIWEM